MNENIDLTKILKDCPKGWKLYSSVYGELIYNHMYVSSSASKIYFTHPNRRSILDGTAITIDYSWDGRLSHGEGECTLFPSKDQRDWSKLSAPWYKKEKFDPKTLHPYDKVLVRDSRSDKWRCQLFSHLLKDDDYFCACIYSSYRYGNCIPYNDDTKHLIGTTDEVNEFYRYWEE